MAAAYKQPGCWRRPAQRTAVRRAQKEKGASSTTGGALRLNSERPGFEPGERGDTPFNGLANRNSDGAGDDNTSTYEHDAEILASYLVFWQRNCPDLALVVEAWAHLPEAVRAEIVAKVQAAQTQEAKG